MPDHSDEWGPRGPCSLSFVEDPQGQTDWTPAWAWGGFAEAPEMNKWYIQMTLLTLTARAQKDKWAVHSGIRRAVQWKTA